MAFASEIGEHGQPNSTEWHYAVMAGRVGYLPPECRLKNRLPFGAVPPWGLNAGDCVWFPSFEDLEKRTSIDLNFTHTVFIAVRSSREPLKPGERIQLTHAGGQRAEGYYERWTTSAVCVNVRGEEGIPREDRDPGDGLPTGAHGYEYGRTEYCFAVTATPQLAEQQNPNNSWRFDDPGESGGVHWHDHAPPVSLEFPHLWRAQRAVPENPQPRQEITDTWTTPAIVKTYSYHPHHMRTNEGV